jgi:hypothetical protein
MGWNQIYFGTGSRTLNDLGVTPATGGPAGEPDTDETSSIASNVSTGSNDSVETVATDVTLGTNASGASVDTTNTDVDLSAGSSTSTVPTVPAGSREDGWYDVDIDLAVMKKLYKTFGSITILIQ